MADFSIYREGATVDVFRLSVEVVHYSPELRELTVVDEAGEEHVISEDDTAVSVRRTPRGSHDLDLRPRKTVARGSRR